MKRTVLIALLSTFAMGAAACTAASARTETGEAAEANESPSAGANEGPAVGEASEAVQAGVAKLTLADARAIALRVRPGKIIEGELEREAGGSGVRYSFVIKAAGKDFEVGVDAADGKILENLPEGANPD